MAPLDDTDKDRQRLRLEDRLTYLAHDELAFTPDESVAAAFLRTCHLELRRDQALSPTCTEADGRVPGAADAAVASPDLSSPP